MFVALYEMEAKLGHEAEFEQAWADVTKAILRVQGSLGSRLHTTCRPGHYIAYAQWPSDQVFDENKIDPGFSTSEAEAFERMKSSASSIKLLHRLNVRSDLLKLVKA